MEILQDFSLYEHNTFGMNVKSKHACEVTSMDDLREIIGDGHFRKLDKLVLGGGSNILFTRDFDGLVLLNRLKGIDVLEEDDQSILVKVGAGEVWHDFVMHCIDRGWGGVENLSLIPGNVGAAPMQNIGAYGVELISVFEELEAVHQETGEIRIFKKGECEFGYRTSIFKTHEKGNYVIAGVTMRLTKQHKINTSYGAIEQELEHMGVRTPTIKDVSDAVVSIRRSKLPDPSDIGNAGSFFKNPVIDKSLYEVIKGEHPDAPSYPVNDTKVKVPAGWLIEHLGWKGKRFDHHGVHARQALVLVNYGGAKGSDVYDLSQRIIDSVQKHFHIILEREVNVL